MECMFIAQGPSVLHAIEVAVVQFAQVHLVLHYCHISIYYSACTYRREGSNARLGGGAKVEIIMWL